MIKTYIPAIEIVLTPSNTPVGYIPGTDQAIFEIPEGMAVSVGEKLKLLLRYYHPKYGYYRNTKSAAVITSVKDGLARLRVT